MTITGTAEAEIARYLTGVRAALADLPEDVREELLEDEPAHLAEVLAEGDGPLDARLGPPERYAAELRTAAGLATPAARSSVDSAAAVVVRLRERMRRADTTIGPVLGYAHASELLRLLRPGWWILRGYLAGLLILNEFGDSSVARFVPFYGSQSWAWLLVVGVCVLASVRLGQATPRLGRPWRWGLVGGGLFLVFLALVALNLGQRNYDQYSVNYVDPFAAVTDIYPYGPDGRPLSGVALFDQNGNPLQVGDIYMCPHMQGVPPSQVDERMRFTYPLCPPPGWQPGVINPSPSATSTVAPQPTVSASR